MILSKFTLSRRDIEVTAQVLTALVALFSASYAVYVAQKTNRIIQYRYEAQIANENRAVISANMNTLLAAMDISKFKSGRLENVTEVQAAKNTLFRTLDPSIEAEAALIDFLRTFEVANALSFARVDTTKFRTLMTTILDQHAQHIDILREKAKG